VDLQQDQGTTTAVDSLIVHPLVREVSRHHSDVRDYLPRYLALISALLTAVANDLDPRNPGSWARWRILADHCASPLDLTHQYQVVPSGTSLDLFRPAALAAKYLSAAGQLAQ